MGGGKTIDTAKGVSLNLGLPIVVVPTIASNDAPTSRLIVVYDQDHRISEVLKLPRNPDFVVVDTAIVAGAPPRFLVAGIGDAIAKKFEAEQCALTGARNFFDGLPTRAALALCEACYSIIRGQGAEAVDAVKRGLIDESVENTIEATVLLSGIGFESGGLALAHGLTRGLTAQSEARGALHGEMVAWGLLVQLLAEGRPSAFVDDILGFYRKVELPRRLSDLGFSDPEPRTVAEIAETTCREAPYVANMARKLSAERLAACIQELEQRSA
jgi:glycerol dehydrogenase